MTCHGFGGGKVSSSQATTNVIDQLVTQIQNNVDHIKRVYHVKPKEDAIVNYDIIFEFGKCQHSDLIKYIKLEKVIKDNEVHSVSHVDLWIIQKDEEPK